MTLEYPTDKEYKKLIDDYVKLEKTQEHLRNDHGLLVCTHKTKRISGVARKILFGYEDFRYLQSEALDHNSTTRSSAFLIESDSNQQDLIQDLRERKQTATVYGDKDVRVASVQGKDDSIELELDYTIERTGKMEALRQLDKTTEVVIEDVNDEESVAKQEYEKVHADKAVDEFFNGWNADRVKEDEPTVTRNTVSLANLSIENKVKFIRDLITEDTNRWTRRNVEGIEVKRDEVEGVPDEEDLDQELEGIKDAVLSGKRLDSNAFVKQCEKNGFYFTEASVRYGHKTRAREILMKFGFKDHRRHTFEVSVVGEYEETDGEMDPTNFGKSERRKIRGEFRDLLMDLYQGYTSEGVIEETPDEVKP